MNNWRAEKHERYDMWLVGYDGPHGFVTLAPACLPEEARLIAAAPAMMEALQALTSSNEQGRFGEPDFPKAIEQARAAITRATGETK